MIALHRSVHRIIKLHRVILRNSDRSWKIEVDSNRFPPLHRCYRSSPSFDRLFADFWSSSFDLWSVFLFLLGYDKSRSLFPVLFFLFDESRGKGKTSRSKEGAIGTSVERRPRGENLSVES